MNSQTRTPRYEGLTEKDVANAEALGISLSEMERRKRISRAIGRAGRTVLKVGAVGATAAALVSAATDTSPTKPEPARSVMPIDGERVLDAQNDPSKLRIVVTGDEPGEDKTTWSDIAHRVERGDGIEGDDNVQAIQDRLIDQYGPGLTPGQELNIDLPEGHQVPPKVLPPSDNPDN